MNCNFCGRICTSYQLRGRDYEKVESHPPKGVTEVTCGSCVARGALGRLNPIPEPDEINPNMDLKQWRLNRGLKGVKLAKYLSVHKAMVSMVEGGKKDLPANWLPKLKKLTCDTECAKWK